MLENPTPTPPPASDIATKRYAHPNQRNRSLNRRKPADRSDRTNNLYGNDVEKNQVAASRNAPVIDHADAGSSNLLNENPRLRLIPLEGCCSSEASKLLNNRWAAAMHLYNNLPIDSSERPVMCSSSAPAWGQSHVRLPHQIMAATGLSASHVDFLGELRRTMRNANT